MCLDKDVHQWVGSTDPIASPRTRSSYSTDSDNSYATNNSNNSYSTNSNNSPITMYIALTP